MAEKLSKSEMKAVYFGPILFTALITFNIWIVSITFSWNTFFQYIDLPLRIEHDRLVFFALLMPFFLVVLLMCSIISLLTKRKLTPRYEKLLRITSYGLVIVLLGVTPLFSIGSSLYLDYHGYERCPNNNRGLYAGLSTVYYAKSPEYLPTFKLMIEREVRQYIRGKLAELPFYNIR